MSKIAITDYIDVPDIEREILGDLVGYDIGPDTERGSVLKGETDYKSSYVLLFQTSHA